MKNDPRVTRVGKLLRRTSLDELPQVFNILRGEMSWVGPRPPVPERSRAVQRLAPAAAGNHAGPDRPVAGERAQRPSFDDMVKLDLYYAENWSLAFDLKIILMTIPAVLKARGAY